MRQLGWGFLGALLFHAGLFYGGAFFASPSRRPAPPPVEDRLIKFEFPPLEPEKPETVPELEPSAASSGEPAPPVLADIPTAVPINAFVQPLQPPSVGLAAGHGLTTIPIGPPGTGTGIGRGMSDLFDLNSLDQPPEVRTRVDPVYPPDLKRRGVAGQVEIEYIIDAQGRVAALTVLRCSHVEFETPACDAVQRWTYRPGRKNGRAVNTWVHQVITFSVEST